MGDSETHIANKVKPILKGHVYTMIPYDLFSIQLQTREEKHQKTKVRQRFADCSVGQEEYMRVCKEVKSLVKY